MKKYIFAICLATLAQPVQAEDCADLGIDNAYLRELFCTELQEIIGHNSTTRSITDGSDTSDSSTDELWRDIEVLKHAFRADPETTLELIERIRQAGGLVND